MMRFAFLIIWLLALPIIVLVVGFGGFGLFNPFHHLAEFSFSGLVLALGLWAYVLLPLPILASIVAEL
uniref:hypothetical protein n=1 Tax=uncultured Erythrobacter sp. TaxID=263913 RepID=UPI0026153613|nr:hypothetical protein [uncultured Erythrobacter sp.]